MPARVSTGKRLRFDVFERDHFTCQYCGGQPPAVVLVVDHVLAVANGGTTDINNLVTSCEPCNQGKAARVLGDIRPRPDADLLYLAVQQELAEARRYEQASIELREVQTRIIARIQDDWCEASGLPWAPSDLFLLNLINQYGYEPTELAVQDVAPKMRTGYLSAFNNKWRAYLNAVARNIANERFSTDQRHAVSTIEQTH